MCEGTSWSSLRACHTIVSGFLNRECGWVGLHYHRSEPRFTELVIIHHQYVAGLSCPARSHIWLLPAQPLQIIIVHWCIRHITPLPPFLAPISCSHSLLRCLTQSIFLGLSYDLTAVTKVPPTNRSPARGTLPIPRSLSQYCIYIAQLAMTPIHPATHHTTTSPPPLPREGGHGGRKSLHPSLQLCTTNKY